MSQLTLEELVVKLRADITDFNSKMKAAEQKAGEATGGIGDAFGSLLSPLKSVTGSIGGLGTIAAAAGITGFAVLTKHALETADNIGDLAANIGVSTDLIQQMGHAAAMNGVSTEEMNTSLARFSRVIGDAAIGNETAEKAFSRLGISVKNADGSLKSTETLLFAVSDKTKNLGSEAERSALLFDLFGRSGGNLGQLMSQGSDALRKYADEANRLGIVLSADVIQRAGEANDKVDALSKALSMQMTSALASLAPEISAAADGLAKVAKWTADATSAFVVFFDSMRSTAQTKDGKLMQLTGQLEYMEKRLKEMTTSSSLDKFFQNLGFRAAESATKVEELRQRIEAKKKEIWDLSTAEKGNAETKRTVNSAIQDQIDLEEKLKRTKEQAQSIIDGVAKGGNDPEAKAQAEIAILQEAAAQKLKIHGSLQDAMIAKEIELGEIRDKLERDKIHGDFEAAEATRAALEQEYQSNVSLIDSLRILDAEANAEKIAAAQANIDAIIAAKALSAEKQVAIEADQKRRTESLEYQKFQAMQTLFGGFAAFQNDKNKEVAAIGKAAAIAQATINTFQAASLAIATIPPPWGFAAAAGNIAFGMAQVANITGTKFAGGIDEVPGTSNRDTVPAVLMPGERVVPKQTNMDLKAFLSAQPDNGRVLEAILGALQNLNSRPVVVKVGSRQIFSVMQDEYDAGRRLG